ncbi:MAG: hypothetical protein A3I26_00370 [Candidatus Yanofskybacteria bacterium RIFCSPLOWO2_02_FULL_43_10]|nr:MAG: hypothetical protein A3C69_03420 [Candidatus Yanofskybacteria bacterium RIFCSPHIGHO2_02_FULL_43_12]OGN30558.1 MAG: hypothetical protein A3I26_00370 [Candidatus Yanofskybacteria bacterium RIFCSPLOWO2_02_FULL_43_10]
MNRVDFVIRQLRYYASVGCQHIIYIGDSSSKEESEKIQNEIKRLGDTINVKYYYLPPYNIWQAHYYLLTQVKEKYTCLSGDDDYQIPDSITKCAEFLETNQEYTTASGHAVSFRLKQNGVHGELLRLADYKRRQIENNTGAERIINFFDDNYFVTFFSVNRTNQTREYWKSSEKISDQAFGSEILPNSLSLIHGKSKILDCLGFVRQIHGQNNGLLGTFDWITSSEWCSSYSLFEKVISENLATKDNISTKDAVGITKQAFLAYLHKQFNKVYNEDIPVSKRSYFYGSVLKSIRSKITKIFPFLKYIYRVVVKPRLTGKKELHYEVLRTESEYYKDFKPVMDSFTGH